MTQNPNTSSTTPATQPTPPPGPEAARVAELEKKLTDAAAEVAKVQAELSQARAADLNTPQVPVPYSGQAPVVMINGQAVPGGQAVDISAMLGGFFGGMTPGVTTTPDGATAIAMPPVVSVNGQVVSSGQPVDLSQFVGPEVAAQIRTSISQLGLDPQVGAMFGATSPPAVSAEAGNQYASATVVPGTPGEVSGRGWLGAIWVLVAVLLVAGLVWYFVQRS